TCEFAPGGDVERDKRCLLVSNLGNHARPTAQHGLDADRRDRPRLHHQQLESPGLALIGHVDECGAAAPRASTVTTTPCGSSSSWRASQDKGLAHCIRRVTQHRLITEE